MSKAIFFFFFLVITSWKNVLHLQHWQGNNNKIDNVSEQKNKKKKVCKHWEFVSTCRRASSPVSLCSIVSHPHFECPWRDPKPEANNHEHTLTHVHYIQTFNICISVCIEVYIYRCNKFIYAHLMRQFKKNVIAHNSSVISLDIYVYFIIIILRPLFIFFILHKWINFIHFYLNV